MRKIVLDNLLNTRDLGGIKTKHGYKIKNKRYTVNYKYVPSIWKKYRKCGNNTGQPSKVIIIFSRIKASASCILNL